MKVLVVDDDPVFRALVKGWLKTNCGISADEASNGAQALRHLDVANGQFNVVVLDINMPDVDGIEVLSALSERGNGTPVLFATGTTPEIMRAALVLAAAYRLNVVGMMSKPFKARDFGALIGTVIPIQPMVA